MDRTGLHLLLMHHGRCPVCQGLLLHADRQPQSPQEWEQRMAATPKAIAKRYFTMREDGTPDETDLRLIHAQRQRRPVGHGTGSTSACQ
jgi:RNA-directed DNA polymerase